MDHWAAAIKSVQAAWFSPQWSKSTVLQKTGMIDLVAQACILPFNNSHWTVHQIKELQKAWDKYHLNPGLQQRVLCPCLLLVCDGWGGSRVIRDGVRPVTLGLIGVQWQLCCIIVVTTIDLCACESRRQFKSLSKVVIQVWWIGI